MGSGRAGRCSWPGYDIERTHEVDRQALAAHGSLPNAATTWRSSAAAKSASTTTRTPPTSSTTDERLAACPCTTLANVGLLADRLRDHDDAVCSR
jgi:hypothetical protein